MKLSIGDRLVVKEKMVMYKSDDIKYTILSKGEELSIEDIIYDFYIVLSTPFDKADIRKYFYTKIEERELKLNKLKRVEWIY